MGRLKKIAEKFLKNPAELKSGNGLYASLDELMSMRRYASYLKFGKLNKTFSNQAGEIRSAFKGRGIELEELREYGFGDDVRDIDWRVTARKEKPYTRVYLEEKDKEVYVWLDLSPLMLVGSLKELKSVTAAKTAALLGWFSLINKDRFGCVVFDGHKSWMFKAKNDRAYLAAMLKKISALSEEALSSKSFDDSERQKSLKLLQKNVKSKANVFLISSFDSWLTDFLWQDQLGCIWLIFLILWNERLRRMDNIWPNGMAKRLFLSLHQKVIVGRMLIIFLQGTKK